MQNSSSADAGPRTLATTRHFDATPDQVFAAFEDGERLARWWGPAGFTNTFTHFDFTPGGNWRFTMHAPGGTNYPNESRFVEISAPHRLVFEHLSNPHYVMTIDIAAEPRGATLTWSMEFDTVAACEGLRKIVVPGNEQNLDKLAAELDRDQS